MSEFGFNGLDWVWTIYILLNEPKWIIGFLGTQPIYYPFKPTHLPNYVFKIFQNVL
jgi:hypothetical protein